MFGPNPWPSRSPDLMLLDIFLWGYIKKCVLAKHVYTLKGLCYRNPVTITAVDTGIADQCGLSSRIFSTFTGLSIASLLSCTDS
jgi:hypothetical protein